MISRAGRAKLVTTVGAASVAGGVYGFAGWPAAAAAGGAYVVYFGLVLMETDDAPKPPSGRRKVIER